MLVRQLLFTAVILSSLSSCDGHDTPELDDPQQELFDFAAQHFPDDVLEGLPPEGFSITEIKRYGRDRHDNDWITIGTRMEGPVPFARAIYYVHPKAAAARDMYMRQTEMTKDEWRLRRRGILRGPIPRPFTVLRSMPTLCGVGAGSLYWCHGLRDRVYMLIQSSAENHASSFRMTGPTLRRRAVALTKAFGSYLREELSR